MITTKTTTWGWVRSPIILLYYFLFLQAWVLRAHHVVKLLHFLIKKPLRIQIRYAFRAEICYLKLPCSVHFSLPTCDVRGTAHLFAVPTRVWKLCRKAAYVSKNNFLETVSEEKRIWWKAFNGCIWEVAGRTKKEHRRGYKSMCGKTPTKLKLRGIRLSLWRPLFEAEPR